MGQRVGDCRGFRSHNTAAASSARIEASKDIFWSNVVFMNRVVSQIIGVRRKRKSARSESWWAMNLAGGGLYR